MKAYVFDAITKKPLNGSTVSIYEGNKLLIKQELKDGNVLSYDNIGFGKKYITRATKDLFQGDTSFVVTEALSTSNKLEYSDSMYLTPFTGLPLTLYFDNDYPNPSTELTKTTFTYGQTFESYIVKRQEFITKYYEGTKTASANGANEVDQFFTNGVQYGHDKLMEFCNLLNTYLSQGRKLQIVIEGHASPLSNPTHNLNLSARRISSVINHLGTYAGGILEPYLNGDNPALEVRIDPEGANAPATVSGDPNNRKASVYSVEASKERRVTIKEINSKGESSNIITGAESYKTWKSQTYGVSTPDPNTSAKNRKGKGATSSSNANLGVSNSYTADNSIIGADLLVTDSGVKSASKKRKGKKSISVDLGSSTDLAISSSSSSIQEFHGTETLEVMMADAYTRRIMDKGSYVITDQSTGKIVKRGSPKGKSSAYTLDATKDYAISASATGYTDETLYHYADYVGGGLKRDTIYLTPTLSAQRQQNSFSALGTKGESRNTNNTNFESSNNSTISTKQNLEVVLVDSYTGKIINSGNVFVADQSSAKQVKRKKKKGKSVGYVLDATKDYIVKANVAGYSEGIQSHYANYSATSTTLSDTIYLTPFSGLPLSLYFDNDYPNPHSTSTETSLNYGQTYRSYLTKKSEFIRTFNKLLQNNSYGESQGDMETFFSSDVKGNYERLAGYASIVKSYLERGSEIEIAMEGSASARSLSDYNEKLIQRRVKSVINYFEQYSGGSLAKYIKSGQLKITVEPAASFSNTTLGNLDDLNTIYSVWASKARRVSIKDIRILNNEFYKQIK